jgi:hypothetical protein
MPPPAATLVSKAAKDLIDRRSARKNRPPAPSKRVDFDQQSGSNMITPRSHRLRVTEDEVLAITEHEHLPKSLQRRRRVPVQHLGSETVET